MSAPEPEPPTGTCHVRVGTLSLRCSIRGPDSGRPLLLVNGLGANVEMWAPLRRSLGPRRTIAFDAPGSGRSSIPVRPLSMRELGRVTLGLLDELGLGEVDVLGYSFGGAVAQELARAAPARVHRMVLAATTCGWGARPADPLAWSALLTPARYYSRSVSGAVTAVFGEGPTAEYAMADAARLRSPPHPLGYAWQLAAAVTWSSLPWLHRIRVPTLVLAAERDRMVHASTPRLLARRIPGARLHVVPGASHFFLLRENGDHVSRAITDFLDGGCRPQREPASAEGPVLAST